MQLDDRLREAVQAIESLLDHVDDPVARMQAADSLRADLAVLLTHSVRKSAYEARAQGAWTDLLMSTWRGPVYLSRLANQYADDSNLPRAQIRDIVTRRHLDLTDLARLRGQTR
jgi:hypothetical protein